MGFLNWLFGKAAQIDEQLPPPEVHEFAGRKIDIPANDPEPETTATPLRETEALENFFCEIEYIDSTGELSCRPITMLSISRDSRFPSLTAVCHMRRAIRTFRTDRIKSIITADGEFFPGQTFFTNTLGINLSPQDGDQSEFKTSPAKVHSPARAATTPQRKFRDIILPALTVLVACGKADGHLHPEEVDRIMIWTEDEALHLYKAGEIPRAMSIEEAEALGRTITSMRPQARALQRHIINTLTLPQEMLIRFRQALQRVIHADGLLHAQETAFMEEFDRLAGQAIDNPKALKKTVAAAFETTGNPLPSVDLKKAIFVFTGQLSSMTRNEARLVVEARNGLTKNHVDFPHQYYTAYLVSGEGSGSKLTKARETGMSVLTEGEFRTMMGNL